MSLQEKEIKIKEIELELLKLKDDQEIDHTLQIKDLENTKAKIEAEAYQDISAYDRVYHVKLIDQMFMNILIIYLMILLNYMGTVFTKMMVQLSGD